LGLRLSGPDICLYLLADRNRPDFLPQWGADSGILSTNSEPEQKVDGPMAPLPDIDPSCLAAALPCIPDGVNAVPPLD
jgi:hypothetical protein